MGKLVKRIKSRLIYKKNLKELKRQEKYSRHAFAFGRAYPCLDDRFSQSGSAKGHYFHQDLLVAQKIFADNPECHIDIGSRVDGFVAHVASYRKIDVLDVRPLEVDIKNITFRQCDVMNPLDETLIGSTDSLSCLHALEHFGLGRYGDPVNYDGYLIAFENLGLMLKNAGKLYLSVPIGPERIEFDAHRVFSIEHLTSLFNGKYEIKSFSYVDDKGDLFMDMAWQGSDADNNYGCRYGCGIFELTKIQK